jgi:glycosyltransferase involved in cell wall biosynthesis
VDLSVVIACKNEADRFGTMLDSLARQSWNGSWEVVVADNGSTDATQAVAQSYSDRLPQLRVVDAADRPGPAHARNRGVEQSAGQKILFVDADDEVADGYIAAMASALDTDELVCARLGFERLNPPWVREIWPTQWQQDRPLDDFGFLPFAGCGTLGIRRSLFEEVGGFRQHQRPTFEEADLCWRIKLAGHASPVVVPDAILHYRLPATLRTMYRRGCNYARGQLALYETYRDHGMRPLRRVSFRDVVGAARRIRKRRDLARTAHVLGRLVGQRSGRAIE